MKATELRDRAKLWLRAKYPDAHILHELSLAEYGGALVDVAAILPDQIVGIEIKGEGDSHARLALQGGMYSRVCRTMHMLADESLREKCRKAMPPGWGELYVATEEQIRRAADPNEYSSSVICAASGLASGRYSSVDSSGYGLAPVALAAMPWTKEYPTFQRSLGMGFTGLPRTKAKCIEHVVANFPLRVIEKAVCAVLRERDWERKVVETCASNVVLGEAQ